jgi:hypothetical protein
MRRGQPKYQSNLTDSKFIEYLRKNLSNLGGGGGGEAIAFDKQTYYAAWFNPLHENSAYYLEALTPSYVFTDISTTGIKLLINRSQVPSNTTHFKYRVESFYTGSPSAKGVAWSAKAAFAGTGVAPTFGTAVIRTVTLGDENVKSISDWSDIVTINGATPVDNDTIIVQIDRKDDNAGDTLNVDAKLVWVELEWITD